MKILMVNARHFYGGGDSVYCFTLATLLRSQGHKVAFFAMQDSRNLPDPNADLFVSHMDFQEMHRKKNLVTGAQVLSRAIYSREARRKFRRMLGRFTPDVVHLHNIHAHITPSVILEARQHGVPVVWTLHDYKLVCPNSHFLIDATGKICEACGQGNFLPALRNRCKKGSYSASALAALEAYGHKLMGVKRRVNRFLTPSSFLRGKIITGGIPAPRVTHLPLFLQDEMFNGGVEDQGYLLFLGKLDPIKGIYPLLEAARLAPEVKLLLAGGVNATVAGALNNLLPANARYLGMKSREEVRRLLAGARALVLPSIWYENQPLAILEAFAAGKPVIASDLGGMTELVKDGERGLLVPHGDVTALAEGMRWMSANPGKAKDMGKAAQVYAIKTHAPDYHYQKVKQIYEEVIII
jgi:glycosyltransferase involved in cell wall biosynthesis